MAIRAGPSTRESVIQVYYIYCIYTTADAPVSVFNPWVKPGPKAHAYLLFGFSLARANARMLINADSKRRSARNSVRASRPQSTSAVAVHGAATL